MAIEKRPVGRPRSKNPLSVSDRAKRCRDKKRQQFGLNSVGLWLTDTEMELLERLKVVLDCKNRQDLMTLLLHEEGRRHGILLKDIKRELDEQKANQA